MWTYWVDFVISKKLLFFFSLKLNQVDHLFELNSVIYFAGLLLAYINGF